MEPVYFFRYVRDPEVSQWQECGKRVALRLFYKSSVGDENRFRMEIFQGSVLFVMYKNLLNLEPKRKIESFLRHGLNLFHESSGNSNVSVVGTDHFNR